jgi:hypothetical protein
MSSKQGFSRRKLRKRRGGILIFDFWFLTEKKGPPGIQSVQK